MEIDALEALDLNHLVSNDMVIISGTSGSKSKNLCIVEREEERTTIVDAVMQDGTDATTESHDGSDSELSQDAFDFASDKDASEESDRFELAHSFNMQLLRSSISNGSEALKHLKGKDVVLVVGKTGSGKSTVVQCIAGKRMYTTSHQTTSSSGEVLDKTVFEAENPLKGFDIGHDKVSETKYIHFYSLTVKKKELVFLDTPGFQDTEGHEIDIATSVMLSEVAKIAGSLRFVIMINYVSLLEDRGTAVKGILKLVRTFVSDFEASKFAFMFLFTHTNESSKIQPKDSLSAAREAVRQEIMWTMEGTRDADLWQVLNFMQKSLKKGYPLVDVFHPMVSDADVLKTHIKRLKAVPGDHLRSHCGLTATSQLKLSGELNKLYQDVRSILESESPDLDRARELLHTFRELDISIPVNDVHVVASNVYNLFCGFISDNRKVFHEQLELGISDEHIFGRANTSTIHRCMRYLNEVQGEFPEEVDMGRIHEEMVTRLAQYCEKVKVESNESMVNIHRRLSKLCLWSDEFPELKEYYQSCVEHVSKLISSATAVVDGFDEISQLEEAPDEWIREILFALHFIEPVVVFSEQLEQFIDVSEVLRASAKAKSIIMGALDAYAQVSLSPGISVRKREHDVLHLASQARRVEAINSLLVELNDFPSFQEKSSSVCRQLQAVAADFMHDACAQARKVDVSNVNLVSESLDFLLETYTAFSDLAQYVWNEVLAPYISVIDFYKEFLKSKSREISVLTKMARDNGVKDGRGDRGELMLFKSYMFFDKFLASGDRFVANCCVAFEVDYKTRSKTVMDMATVHIENLTTQTGEPLDHIRALKLIVREQQELSYLAEVLTDQALRSAETETRAKLQIYIQGLGDRTQNS